MKFDLVARRLLRLVQSDNKQPLDRMVREAGASRSAIQRRLQDMRRLGVIRKDVALLDRRLIGRIEIFIVRLELRWEHRHLFERFRLMVCDLAAVQQCYITTGRLNCIAVVLLPDAEALDAFVTKHFAGDPLVRGYRTSLVTRELKVSLDVPLEPPRENGKNEPDHP